MNNARMGSRVVDRVICLRDRFDGLRELLLQGSTITSMFKIIIHKDIVTIYFSLNINLAVACEIRIGTSG